MEDNFNISYLTLPLAPANVKAENLTNGATADKMTIALMKMVALQWLRKTNPDLLTIMKTEYSTELRSNTQLAELVPRIAPNIDSLIRRYEQGSSSNKVSIQESEPEAVDTAAINKTWSRGYGQGRGTPAQGRRGGGLPGRAAGIAGQSGAPGGRGGAPQEGRGPHLLLSITAAKIQHSLPTFSRGLSKEKCCF